MEDMQAHSFSTGLITQSFGRVMYFFFIYASAMIKSSL